jgi:hypothetical protein
LRECRRWLRRGIRQQAKRAHVEFRRAFQVGVGDVFVDLVNAGVDRPDLDALRTKRCDEKCAGSKDATGSWRHASAATSSPSNPASSPKA